MSMGRAGDDRGFTLVEVMVALTVLSIGLLAVAQMMPRATRGMNFSKKVSSGTFAADQVLENLRTLAAGDAGLTAGNHPASGYTVLAAEPTLSYRYFVSDLTGSMSGVKKVTVTAKWINSRAESLQAVSYVRPQ